ncbi:hypothetical protein [Nonomuraea sp. NPDC049695]
MARGRTAGRPVSDGKLRETSYWPGVPDEEGGAKINSMYGSVA